MWFNHRLFIHCYIQTANGCSLSLDQWSLLPKNNCHRNVNSLTTANLQINIVYVGIAIWHILWTEKLSAFILVSSPDPTLSRGKGSGDYCVEYCIAWFLKRMIILSWDSAISLVCSESRLLTWHNQEVLNDHQTHFPHDHERVESGHETTFIQRFVNLNLKQNQ